MLAQGLVFTVHNDLVLAKADTRQVARDWMVQNIPSGTNIVVEPIAPDQWAMDVGHPLFEKAGRDGLRQPLEQVAHVALLLPQRQARGDVGLLPGGQDRGLRAHDAA